MAAARSCWLRRRSAAHASRWPRSRWRMVVMYAVNATGTLRCVGGGRNCTVMDLHEHGISAYPEYMISPFAAPCRNGSRTPFPPWKAQAFRRRFRAPPDLFDFSGVKTWIPGARPAGSPGRRKLLFTGMPKIVVTSCTSEIKMRSKERS